MRGVFVVSALVVAGCYQPKLELDPATVPNARVGSPYRAVVNVRNTRTPIGDVSATSLPPGLAIAHEKMEDSFTISGVPTVAGDFHGKLDVWCYGTNFAGQRLDTDLAVHVLPR